MTQYILKADEPFAGHVQSVLMDNGTVAYTDGLTVAEYERERGFPVRIVSEAELDQLLAAHYQSLKTKPLRITEDRFDWMLNVLPPCRWHRVGGFEVFHVSERLTGPLVSWFAHRGADYWEFTEDCRLSDGALAVLLSETEVSP